MRLVHAVVVWVSVTLSGAATALADTKPTLAIWPVEAAGPQRRVHALVVAAASARAEWQMPAAGGPRRTVIDQVKAGCRRRPVARCAIDLANAVGAGVALLIDQGPRQTGLVLLDAGSGRELGRKVIPARAKPAVIASAIAALAGAMPSAAPVPVPVAAPAPPPPGPSPGDAQPALTAPPRVAAELAPPAPEVPAAPPATEATATLDVPAAPAAMDPIPALALSTRDPERGVPAPAAVSPRFGVGVHLDLLIPTARTGDVTFNGQMEPAADRTVTVAVLAEGRYYLPSPLTDVAVSLEVGWYRLSSAGSRVNDADPDFPSFSYSSSVHAFPALLGAWYRLPRFLPLLPLQLHAGGGLSAEYVQATTSYTAAGTATENAAQTDFAWGYWVAGEVGLELGPGLVTGTVRYVSARTDLRFSQIYAGAYNEQPGETGGTSVLVGYRLQL